MLDNDDDDDLPVLELVDDVQTTLPQSRNGLSPDLESGYTDVQTKVRDATSNDPWCSNERDRPNDI